MPAIDTSTPRVARKFAEHAIQAPMPFAEGHALTANEALWLNTAVAGTVGNHFGGDIRRAREAGKDALAGTTAQDAFDAKYTAYVLGESNRGGDGFTAADPVTAAAKAIATAKVKELLTSKGYKVGDVQKAKSADGKTSKFAELVSKFTEANPWVLALAESQVAAMASQTDDLDGLDFGTVAPDATEEPAAAA